MKVAIIKKGGVIDEEFDIGDYLADARKEFPNDDADTHCEIAVEQMLCELTYSVKREIRREIRR